MLGLYLQAGFKRAVEISPATLEALQRAPVLWQTFLPDTRHYRRYCQLVGWSNPDVVHPFYWQVKGLPLQLRLLAHPKSPFKLLGLVHLQNRVDTYAECRVDIPCELVARFDGVFQHRRGLAVDVTVTGTQRGKRVYSATGTYLMRSSLQITTLPAYETQMPAPGESADVLTSCSFSGVMVRRYAGISGDLNPIHLSTLTAKLFGFKRAIVHGMYSGACAVSALDQAGSLAGEEVSIAFKRPMLVPATARLLAEETGTARVYALAGTDRQQAETFLTGQIKAINL